MGIFSAGITTMGLKVWSPAGPSFEQTINRESSLPSKNIFAYPSKAKALQEAKKLGYELVDHRMELFGKKISK